MINGTNIDTKRRQTEATRTPENRKKNLTAKMKVTVGRELTKTKQKTAL